MVRILKKYLPDDLDFTKISDYILCHDLPEAITGDITKFEGVSSEEIKRVTEMAIEYLGDTFNGVMNIREIIGDYEARVDIESKVVNMLDKLHSSTTFIKYESEQHVDLDDPRIIPELRQLPFVVKDIEDGCDLADIFFKFHIKAVNISDEECEKYSISREYADQIVNAIRGFGNEIYSQKLNGTLLDTKNDFPQKAMIYNRNAKKVVN